MSDDKKPLVVQISDSNEDWMSTVRKDKTAKTIVARFQKDAAEMDVQQEWEDIVRKHAKAEQDDMDALLKKMVPYLKSVGYDLDVSKSYLGKEMHGSDGNRRRGALVITERKENTVKMESPAKVAQWVASATGLHGSAKRIDGDTWLVDIDEN